MLWPTIVIDFYYLKNIVKLKLICLKYLTEGTIHKTLFIFHEGHFFLQISYFKNLFYKYEIEPLKTFQH
jgi:hypothetical protein